MPATDAKKHAVTTILKDLSSVAGVRFSIGKAFWADRDFYDGLPDRVLGTFARWLNKEELIPKIVWDDGGDDTQVGLCDLLPAVLAFKLEQYADGRSAPAPNKRRVALDAAATAAAANAHAQSLRRSHTR